MDYYKKPNPNQIRIMSRKRMMRLKLIPNQFEIPKFIKNDNKRITLELGYYFPLGNPGLSLETYKHYARAKLDESDTIRSTIRRILEHLFYSEKHHVIMLVDEEHPSDSVAAQAWKSFLLTGGDHFG